MIYAPWVVFLVGIVGLIWWGFASPKRPIDMENVGTSREKLDPEFREFLDSIKSSKERKRGA